LIKYLKTSIEKSKSQKK